MHRNDGSCVDMRHHTKRRPGGGALLVSFEDLGIWFQAQGRACIVRRYDRAITISSQCVISVDSYC